MKTPLNYQLKFYYPEWADGLNWLNCSHYDILISGHSRVTYGGQFLFHLLPGALPDSLRRELFALALLVADGKGSSTRRMKVVGGGHHPLTKAGTPSVYPRAYPLHCLQHAREGTFGFEVPGRGLAGVGCCETAFNRRWPDEYKLLISKLQITKELFRQFEPQSFEPQFRRALTRTHLMLNSAPGRDTVLPWNQGVSNVSFPMVCHRDDGNLSGSVSAQLMFGDYSKGELIFPEYRVAAALNPGDILLFNGHAAHGVAPFDGIRNSVVLYLQEGIFRCGTGYSIAPSTVEQSGPHELPRVAETDRYCGRPVIHLNSLPRDAPEPSFAICLKGTHGSGKSTICKMLLDTDPEIAYVRFDVCDRKPLATYSPIWNTVVLGTYPSGRSCGGCDGLDSTGTVKRLLASLWTTGVNILFEGILPSGIKTPILDFMLDQQSHKRRNIGFAFLDTPINECLRRIYERNGGRTINEGIVRAKHRAIAGHKTYYEQRGIKCTVVDTSGPREEVFQRFLALYFRGLGE